jgi:hypothetical protein
VTLLDGSRRAGLVSPGFELAAAQQRPDVEVASEPGVVQAVDDDCRAQPHGTRVLDESPRAEGLTAGVDPVVDEEHPLARPQQVLGEPEAEVAVPVVGWCRPRPPGVAVGGRPVVLADLHEADTEVERDEGAQQRAA